MRAGRWDWRPKMEHGFTLIAKSDDISVYRRWDPVLLKRITVRFEGKGDKKLMHVKMEQPKWVVNTILENNVQLQNNFSGYGKGDGFYRGASIPAPIYGQFMEASGRDPITGEYDEKKFKSLVNDSDHSKLRVVPGKI